MKFGELHNLTLSHPFERGPSASSRSNGDRSAGSALTIAAAYGQWRGEDLGVTFGPSIRWIADLGRPASLPRRRDAFGVMDRRGDRSVHSVDPDATSAVKWQA